MGKAQPSFLRVEAFVVLFCISALLHHATGSMMSFYGNAAGTAVEGCLTLKEAVLYFAHLGII